MQYNDILKLIPIEQVRREGGGDLFSHVFQSQMGKRPEEVRDFIIAEAWQRAGMRLDTRDSRGWGETNMIYAQTRYMECGEHVYAIGPEMQKTFLRADLKGIKCSDVLMPYDAIFVALPESLQTLEMESPSHEMLPLVGFHVTRITDPSASGSHENMLMFVPFALGKRAFIDTVYCSAGVFLEGQEGSLGIIEALEEHLKKPFQSDDPDFVNMPWSKQERDREVLRACVRIYVNLALYLGCVNSDVKRVPVSMTVKNARRKARRSRKRKKKESLLTNARISWIAPRLECDLVASGEKGTHGSPRLHAVASHWHRYWTGPRDGERKLVRRYVLSFPRGGKEGDTLPEGPKIKGVRKQDDKEAPCSDSDS